MPAPMNQQKYFMIKLMKSGRSLRETKALMYAVSTGLTEEYAQQQEVEDLLKLDGFVHSVTQTRGQARQAHKLKLERRSQLASTREEVASKFVTGYRGNLPMSWKRDGNLVKRSKRVNPPRPGSSKGKIGKTKITGQKRVLKNLRGLVIALREIENLDKRSGKGSRASTKLRATVTRSISGSY